MEAPAQENSGATSEAQTSSSMAEAHLLAEVKEKPGEGF